MGQKASRRMGRGEFIAMTAVLFSFVAFSVDSLLPAFPAICAELCPTNPNDAQFLVAAFMTGLGLGTFVVGPLSDTLGRRNVLLAGGIAYCVAAFVAYVSDSLALILVARLVQGFGAAGPRVVGLAIVRDQYKGPEMARIVSFATTVFTVIPAIAPLMGQAIAAAFGWRAILLTYCLFGAVIMAWFALRQPETLADENRRSFHPKELWFTFKEVMGHSVVRLAILAQILAFGSVASIIMSVQPIFDRTFGRGDTFALYFGSVAAIFALSSILNAQLVRRIGMQKLAERSMLFSCLSSLTILSIFLIGQPQGDLAFFLFLPWMLSVFFATGMIMGNLNAVALEPVGHVAGMAASLVGGLGTAGAMVLAVPVAQQFDGSPRPMMAGIAFFATTGYLTLRRLRRVQARTAYKSR